MISPLIKVSSLQRMKPVNGLSLTTTPSKRDHNTFTWLKKAKRKLSLRQLTLLLNFSKVNINCPLLWTVCFLGEHQMAQTHLREPLDSRLRKQPHIIWQNFARCALSRRHGTRTALPFTRPSFKSCKALLALSNLYSSIDN